MMRAIVFDLFGVIRPDALEATYRHFGGDPVRDGQFIHDTIVAANRGIIPNSRSVLAERLGTSVAEWKQEFDEFGGNDQRVLDFIIELRARGYKVGLLTNVSRGRMPELFGPGELEKYFDTVVASGDVGYAKPEAQAYEVTADRLSVRLGECVMIDDREEYCIGARGVGMRAILYVDFQQMRSELEALLGQEHAAPRAKTP